MKNHHNIKNNTETIIRKYHKKYNYDCNKTWSLCIGILNSPKASPMLRGELCEVLLVILIEDYIKKNNKKDWFIAKGLILKDIDNPNSSYLTELDVTLFTPKCVYAFECKSYVGTKIIHGKCTVVHGDKTFDVFDQHIKHVITLMKNIAPGKNPDVEGNEFNPYELVLFSFAKGEIYDKRNSEYKQKMKICTEKSLYDLFSDYDDRPDYWIIPNVKKFINVIQKGQVKRQKEHLEYVKGLKHNE